MVIMLGCWGVGVRLRFFGYS